MPSWAVQGPRTCLASCRHDPWPSIIRRRKRELGLKSVLFMELFLNLAWFVVAGALIHLWLEGGGRSSSHWRSQLIAIAVLIAILFPVISMSDDLLAVQNTGEADNYLRRDHLVTPDGNPVQPALALIAAVMFAGIGLAFIRFAAPRQRTIEQPQYPPITNICNRPPPPAF